MTEPTDAEIFVVAREAGLLPDNSHPAPETRAARKHSNAVQAFARAVLAKWGTPPAVAGEPVAWYEYNADLGAWFLAYSHNPKAKTRPLVFGDTTPQPTQAQAGAVPRNVTQPEDALLRNAARRSSKLIAKGGQHGADT